MRQNNLGDIIFLDNPCMMKAGFGCIWCFAGLYVYLKSRQTL